MVMLRMGSISSLSIWADVSAKALKLLYSSSGQCGQFRPTQRCENFADDVSLYAAHDFTAGLAFGHAPRRI